MRRLVAIGECMVELSAAGGDLWQLGVAGDTLNTAWYARACLPQDWAVDYVTRLGRDAFSRRVEQFLAQNGIGTGFVTHHPSRSIGLNAIALQEGERSFSYWRDSSAARTLMEEAGVVDTAMAGAAVIHISGITLAILPEAARAALIARVAAARDRGALTVLDPNYRARLWPDADAARAALQAAAAACALVLPSFDDEAALFGDATPEATLARYGRYGAATVVVKNGAAGVMACAAGRVIALRDLPRVAPVDTTGAGDSFNGAFLAALLQGAALETALRAGHAMALQVVQHRGALLPMAATRAAR